MVSLCVNHGEFVRVHTFSKDIRVLQISLAWPIVKPSFVNEFVFVLLTFSCLLHSPLLVVLPIIACKECVCGTTRHHMLTVSQTELTPSPLRLTKSSSFRFIQSYILLNQYIALNHSASYDMSSSRDIPIVDLRVCLFFAYYLQLSQQQPAYYPSCWHIPSIAKPAVNVSVSAAPHNAHSTLHTHTHMHTSKSLKCERQMPLDVSYYDISTQ